MNTAIRSILLFILLFFITIPAPIFAQTWLNQDGAPLSRTKGIFGEFGSHSADYPALGLYVSSPENSERQIEKISSISEKLGEFAYISEVNFIDYSFSKNTSWLINCERISREEIPAFIVYDQSGKNNHACIVISSYGTSNHMSFIESAVAALFNVKLNGRVPITLLSRESRRQRFQALIQDFGISPTSPLVDTFMDLTFYVCLISELENCA